MGSNHLDKVVMKIGGSLIVPNGGIDTVFLKHLNSFIRTQLASHPDRQFFLAIGAGATARHFIQAGKEVIKDLANEDLDWLGVNSARLSAHLIRTIFHDIAHPVIVENYEIIRKVEEKVVVASAWKPGWSTDYCATLLAEDYSVPLVIKLSKVKQVYSADPNIHSDAKPITAISWDKYRSIIGSEWTPRMNVPFDPIASKKAQELGMKVIFLGGDDFDNIEKYFDGKAFLGTVIE